MDILGVPFNKYMGVKENPVCGDGYLLEDQPIYKNHVGTFHAAAIFSLAEATSGLFLNDIYKEIAEGSLLPVVKKATVQYKRPAAKRITSRNMLEMDEIKRVVEELRTKRKSYVTVPVAIFNENDEECFLGEFEWVLKIQ